MAGQAREIGLATEADIEGVSDALGIDIGTVGDLGDLIGGADHPFGEKESDRELVVMARGPHRHRYARAIDADRERLLGGDAVEGPDKTTLGAVTRDRDRLVVGTLLEGGEVVGRVEIGEEGGIRTFDRHRADPSPGLGLVEKILKTTLPSAEEFLDETEEFRTWIKGGERFPSALGAGHGTCSIRDEAGQEIGLHSGKIDGEDEEKVRLTRGEDGLQTT